MARLKQQLINFHTSGMTNLPSATDVQLGEIVVRHNNTLPQLIIKKTNGNFATFMDSSAVTVAIQSAVTSMSTGEIHTLTQNFNTLSTNVNTFSASVVNNYATKTVASGYAVTAEANAVSSGKGYTDAQITEAKKASSAYTDSVSGILATQIEQNKTDVSSNKTSIETVSSSLKALSGDFISTSAAIVNYIDTKVASVYNVRGSVDTYAGLPNDAAKGDVYNVVAANGTIGQSGYTPAGTNYVWTGEKWDALGGTIDLSNYVTQGALTAATQATTNLGEKVDTLSGSVTALSASVVNNYATKTYADTAAGNAKTEAIETASGYTDQEIVKATNASSAYTDHVSGILATQITTNASNIETLDSATGTLSTNLTAVSGVAVTALQGIKLGEVTGDGTTNQSGAKIQQVTGSTSTLDLTGLIIDCGDF